MKPKKSKRSNSKPSYTSVRFTDMPKRGLSYRYDQGLYFISLPPEENWPEDLNLSLINLIEEDMAQGIHDCTLEKYKAFIEQNKLSDPCTPT
jgi:hypothetical protein